MNKLFLILISAVFFNACSGGANVAPNNQPNVNTAVTATPAANNTKAAVVQETPLPQFTNADEAVAEGVKLLDANSTVKAVEALRQAVKLNPDSGEAYFRLGIAYAQIEKIKKEKELTSTDPTPTPVPAKKVKKGAKEVFAPTTDSEKAFAEAVKAYKKHLIKNPKDDAALFNLGRAYNKISNDEEAEKALRQAVKLKPEDTEYQTELGAILIKLAHYDDAVKSLKKALDIDASNLQADELLQKAQEGVHRVHFGITPKDTNDKPAPNRRNPKPKSTKEDSPRETPKPINANK